MREECCSEVLPLYGYRKEHRRQMGYLAVSATKHCAVGTPYPLPLMTRDANMHFDFAIQPPTNVIDLLSQGRENV